MCLSKGLGIILSGVVFLIIPAKALAAANLCLSVMHFTLLSKAPLKMPGKAKTLFI